MNSKAHRPVCKPVRERLVMWGAVLVVAVGLCAACGSSKSKYAPAPTTLSKLAASDGTTAPRPHGRVEDITMVATKFRNIHAWTKVRDFYVGNLLGHLPQALAVARNPNGGVYPVGTIIQLVPTEAMVKRRPGWDAATHDWEFFSLAVSKSGTRILSRGATKTVNFLHLNCASCHGAAKPQFDETCGHDHGCAPLPLTPALITALQSSDPRPLH
jgi:hypothetical protein